VRIGSRVAVWNPRLPKKSSEFTDKNRRRLRFHERNCNARRVDHTASPIQWRTWLEASARRFLLFARDQTRCEADAQDVLQDALVEVWRRGEGRTPDHALVFATIRRRAIDLARRDGRRELREQVAPDWFHTSAAETAHDDELERAVKSLPSHLREVVVLKVWSELTFQQIADMLGVPLNTAASRYRYALEHLRTALKEVRS
jgi:RNA polymerase sigma-70 factor (ECF subfamily)